MTKQLSNTPNAMRNRKWYAKHRIEVCVQARSRYAADPDKAKVKACLYYQKNKGVISKRTKVYKDTHPGLNSRLSWARHNKLLLDAAGRAKPKRCEVCGKLGKICFDHCHKSKKFRGWICANCNTALGHVKDSVVVLRKLASYLEANKNGGRK